MNILLLSLGGGGGNILRSVKALFRHDVTMCEEADPSYAERLSRSVTTRFLDTNQFSLVDVPVEERLLIGANTTSHLGSRHDPEVAQRAFEESRSDIEALINGYSVVIVIATGGKGTGAGTIVPVTLMARRQKKLVIPIFVRPSFERHEVEKRRFDHALRVSQQFDAANIRFIEILNDRGYVDADPQPQSVVWDRMNVPIARALRGLLYVLWDLSQVDPSDLSTLFAGHGRLRVGFSEIDPPPGSDPSARQIEEAVGRCWENPYCNFDRAVGTSLICLQGQWSNVVDAKIKSRLAACVTGTESTRYNPLYARAFHTPKPWGVTALFAEFTGNHAPIDIGWSVAPVVRETSHSDLSTEIYSKPVVTEHHTHSSAVSETIQQQSKHGVFATFWDLALALNRSDPAALALAQNGAECHVTIDASELKKLLGTLWFRSVFPRLSQTWRDRLLNVLVDSAVVPNHTLRIARRDIRLSEINHAQLKESFSTLSISEDIRTDLRFVLTVGNLWGGESLERLRYLECSQAEQSSRLSGLLHSLRL